MRNWTPLLAVFLPVAAVLLPLPRGLAADVGVSGFDHDLHDGLFPDCAVCHGVADPDAAVWPKAESCAACHDGSVASEMSWAPRTAPWPSNLKFDHEFHIEEGISCEDCHGGPEVVRGKPDACFECHGEASHLEDANDCAECHLPLTEAVAIPNDRVLAWPQPPSHAEKGFKARGHGTLATAQCPAGGGAPTSCAICHSRNFCMTCHVDASERPEIEALALDPGNRGPQKRSERRPDPRRRTPSRRAEPGPSTAGGGRRRRRTSFTRIPGTTPVHGALSRDVVPGWSRPGVLLCDLPAASGLTSAGRLGQARPRCGSGVPRGSGVRAASVDHGAAIPGG